VHGREKCVDQSERQHAEKTIPYGSSFREQRPGLDGERRAIDTPHENLRAPKTCHCKVRHILIDE